MPELDMKVDPELCSGCCTCVHACPINLAIEPYCEDGIGPKTNKVVMRVINGHCRPLNFHLCQAKKFQCRLCEQVCPNGALKLVAK